MISRVSITPDWRGETVAIFASGPSMNATVAQQCRSLRTIAINNQSFDCAPWADVIYGSDAKWWRHYWASVSTLPGRKLSVEIGQQLKGVEYLLPSSAVFDERPGYLSTGANSGYAALCLAVKLGATRVHLHGYDMAARHGRMRRHDYPANLNSCPRFADWIRRFRLLAPELQRRNVEVINCTPGSALTCFPMSDGTVRTMSSRIGGAPRC